MVTRYLLVFMISLVFCAKSIAQSDEPTSLADSLASMEIQMMGLGQEMINSPAEDTRIITCYQLVKLLVKAFRTDSSFYYPFDSLKTISILKDPEHMFRLFSWNLRLDNGYYRYFGVIQINKDYFDKNKIPYERTYFPLRDRSDSAAVPDDSIFDSEHWYGCLYYEMIPVKVKKKVYYTLLGWDGSDVRSNKKIIDVLTWDEGKPIFGGPIFKLKSTQDEIIIKNRLVFEFNNAANMLLRYLPKQKIIVYDNLVPPNPSADGKKETYVPDGSYDYLIFSKKGYWEKGEKLFDTLTIPTEMDKLGTPKTK